MTFIVQMEELVFIIALIIISLWLLLGREGRESWAGSIKEKLGIGREEGSQYVG